MIKRYIATALILILLAPLNAGASAWMADSSSMVDVDEMAMTQMLMMGHDHEVMMSAGQQQAMMDAHDHGPDDCDDYCMSCSNHCSSTAIIPSSSSTIEFDRRFNRTLTGGTLSRAYLLYRPPIFA